MSDAWTSNTPLSNQDFRKLLQTPRPHDTPLRSSLAPGVHQPRPKPAKVFSGDDDKPRKFKKPPPKFSKDKQAEEDEAAKYRDRAKERRDGVEGLDADISAISYEDSKYLGGDLEHTHLVKGLDYALLQQERLKLHKHQGEGGGGDGAAAGGAAPAPDVKFATPLGRAVFEALIGGGRGAAAARRGGVSAADMFAPRRTGFVFELEEGEGGLPTSDIPVTLRRSKADCPPPKDMVTAAADVVLLERISKIMGYIAANTTGKGAGSTRRDPKRSKEHTDFVRNILAGLDPSTAAGADVQVHGEVRMKRASALHGGAATAAAAAAAAAATQAGGGAGAGGGGAVRGGGGGGGDDDADIFGDAGTDYAPELPQRAAPSSEASAKPASAYFDTRDDMSDLPPPPPPETTGGEGEDVDMEVEEGEMQALPPPPPASDGGATSTSGRGGGATAAAPAAHERWRVPRAAGAVAPAAALPSNLQGDAYEELFPEALMGAGLVVDSDEEDGGKPLPGTTGATGEEGAEGAETAAAASAAPVGRRGKPLTARQLARAEEARRNQKMDSQLGKIEKLFEEKGYGNEGAFQAPSRGGRGGGGRGEAEMTPMPAKKRRI